MPKSALKIFTIWLKTKFLNCLKLLTGKKKLAFNPKLLIKMRFIWLKSSFLQKNTLYLGINNLKTKKTWVIHTKTVKEKLTSFTQKT